VSRSFFGVSNRLEEETMWMRSCAVCKVLLRKLRLCDSDRCQCGWEWQGHAQWADEAGIRGRQWRRSLSSTYWVTSGRMGNGSLRTTVGRLSSSVCRRKNPPDRDSSSGLVGSQSRFPTQQWTL